ncbi:MAG: putative 2OG-Fe(II) oxygenase [Rhizomicrobium sp.]
MQIRWIEKPPIERLPPDKALASLRQAVAARPERGEFRLLLAQLLFERGLYPQIADVLGAGLAPAFAAQADYHLGRAANQTGDHGRAIPLLTRAADAALPRADGELATALLRSGARDDAIAAARRGLARDPFDIACLRVLGSALIEQGAAGEAYASAQALWDTGVHRAQVVWTLAAAARALGDDAAFENLTARAPWFAAERLALDNAALAREILAHDTLAASQAYKPIRGRVLRIDDFETVKSPAIEAFHEAVRAAVLRYRMARADRAAHPLIAGWPAQMSLSSWALAMHADGHEDWHIHASSWLSGVYYVRNPARGGDGKAGHVGFGALPAMTRMAGRAVDEWSLAPEPGLLILFPSWYAHRTWPSGAAAERISIAFDAMPA